MERVSISRLEAGDRVWRITGSDRGITGIAPVSAHFLPDDSDLTLRAARELAEYLSGQRRTFTFPLDLRGTAFQLQVWQAVRQIPYGQTRTYGQLAAAIGRPQAVRAVGQAVGRNPCLILVPCHRIVGRAGTLTGFSAGIPLKTRLLQLESVHFVEEID